MFSPHHPVILQWSIRFLSSVLGFTISLVEVPTMAQITPDNSLGTERSNLSSTNVINGGARRGTNLFHSFSEFNIGNGQRIDFANPVGVDRILTRVTGSDRSNILGTLGVLGNADFFLINPNGIVFGRNARLEVRGSFLATTAIAVQFGEQGVFRTDTPQVPSLLTVNPSALWFDRPQPAPIVNQSAAFAGTSPGGFGVFGLRVPNGRNLLLVGGAVQLDQGGVAALGGRVELGGVAAPGRVELTADNRLRFPVGIERADVSLTNGAIIDVAAGGGGDVVVTARNLDIRQQSAIYAGIVAPGGTATRQAGAIILDTTGSIGLDGQGSTLQNSVNANVVGNSGDIQIRGRTFSVTNGATVLALSGRQGNVGNINIEAMDAVTIDGFGSRFSSTITSQLSNGVGKGGSVTLTTRNLSLTNSGALGTSTFARGDAGDIRIMADTITVDGVGSRRSSGITSSVAPGAIGNGGVIDIQTGSLVVTNGGRLFASTFGQGNAGDVRVNARDRVVLDGSGSNQFPSAIVSQVATPGIGNGGNIQITAPTLTLTNGAQLAANTFGRGNAGDITLRVRDAVVFDGLDGNGAASGAFSSVESRAIGNGGNINIQTDSLQLTNNAGLFASTLGRGDAGRIQVQARSSVQLATGGRILSSVEPSGIGNGQEIAIQTRSLRVTDQAQINASTKGNGEAGRIQVDAITLEMASGGQFLTTTTGRRNAGDMQLRVRDRLSLTGENSGLFANTASGSSGNGGTIFVNASNLALQNRARIAVDSQGTGDGGNIQLDTNSLTLKHQASISAETVSNTGGNIALTVRDILLLRRNSLISTTAGKAQGNGDGGNIDINAGFIVAVPSENSDITANAFQGRGGNINITTQGIFGIAFRDRLTPLSDITASSEFGLAGTVIITTLGIDPLQRGADLPTTFSTPPLAQGCRVQGTRTSSFVMAGQGGVPANPGDPIVADTLWQDLSPLAAADGRPSAGNSSPLLSTTSAIVEAQDWATLPDGTIVLTTQAPMHLPDIGVQCR
ncbi:filamentous hemagglutinin N-terminal domain-containing protein [Pantanalinema sp. GBBB05]|uniref:two-partner secretion domain-containing protein n=1 Tax=Pantanalinema sp. GBBB05 TaxID=2604139 RepID=UPI001D4CDE17|nr:filamentous hemagglutinin N-terminal domain-containing protein [Pantanalinema sp. GBBB05]